MLSLKSVFIGSSGVKNWTILIARACWERTREREYTQKLMCGWKCRTDICYSVMPSYYFSEISMDLSRARDLHSSVELVLQKVARVLTNNETRVESRHVLWIEDRFFNFLTLLKVLSLGVIEKGIFLSKNLFQLFDEQSKVYGEAKQHFHRLGRTAAWKSSLPNVKLIRLCLSDYPSSGL